jgi:hypothetical protein
LSIGVGSLGLRRMIDLEGPSAAAALGVIANCTAGALFTAMPLVHPAVKQVAAGAANTFAPDLGAVWLGLDLAWYDYVGMGTIPFAWAMRHHPRFRWRFGASGLAIGVDLLASNLAVSPTPPSAAGLVDLGPLVGLWYLAASLQTWRSLGWARKRLHPEAA